MIANLDTPAAVVKRVRFYKNIVLIFVNVLQSLLLMLFNFCDLNYDDHSFIDINKCSSNPCKNGGTCVNAHEVGRYRCNCKSGFTGPTCNTGNHCHCNATALSSVFPLPY